MARKTYRRMMPDDVMGGGVVACMAAVDGWAMVRRPRCIPFVVPISDWNSWPEITP